jgi:hypothetical protein
MKQLLTILFAIVLFSINTNAQPFQNTIGKPDVIEYGESITQPLDSTYLIAGDFTTDKFISNHTFIAHLKKNGSLDWFKKIGITNKETGFLSTSRAEAVKASSLRPDGYVVITDVITAFYVVRVDNAGAVTWARKFKSDASARRIKPVYDNTGTLTGFFILAVKSGEDESAILMKIGTTGNTIWQKRIKHNTAGFEYRFADLQVTPDGGCIAAGNLYNSNKLSLPVLFKLSGTGVVTWGHAYIFTPNNEIPPRLKGVTVTNAGYVATGGDEKDDNFTFSVGSPGININWVYKYTNGSPDYLNSVGSAIATDASGNLIIACQPDPYPGEKALILKLSPAGVFLFAKKFNTNTTFHDIRVTNKGTYCAVGLSGPGNNTDISVVNISSTGTIKADCEPTAVRLARLVPFSKIIGSPEYSVINEVLTNTAATASTTNIQTQQVICKTVQAADNSAGEASSSKLQVSNDVAGQRIRITWLTQKEDNAAYQAVLYNYFGQPVTTITLRANQTAYIQMNTMQTGIYAVQLQQHSKLVAREKVVWVK